MPTLRTRRPHPIRLGVHPLEARDVPATLDLTVVGAEATANGALFRQADPLPADSGEFNTFLRIRDNGGADGEGD